MLDRYGMPKVSEYDYINALPVIKNKTLIKSHFVQLHVESHSKRIIKFQIIHFMCS